MFEITIYNNLILWKHSIQSLDITINMHVKYAPNVAYRNIYCAENIFCLFQINEKKNNKSVLFESNIEMYFKNIFYIKAQYAIEKIYFYKSYILVLKYTVLIYIITYILLTYIFDFSKSENKEFFTFY